MRSNHQSVPSNVPPPPLPHPVPRVMREQQLMQDVSSQGPQAPDRAMRGDDALRSMVHQWIDVCHVNQRHLTGLREEVTNLRSRCSSLTDQRGDTSCSPMANPPPPSLPLHLCQVTTDGAGCADAQDVTQQSPQDVVCNFARPIVPALGVEFLSPSRVRRQSPTRVHQRFLPISLQQSQMPSAHEPSTVFHGRM